MNNPESHLDQAERHVSENVERIARQRHLIAKLERDGHERLLPDAQELLLGLEENQRLAIQHLDMERAKSDNPN